MEQDFPIFGCGKPQGSFLAIYRRQRQRPGLAPAGDLLFLLVQAKNAKEHDPAVCVPALRYGQTSVTPFSLRCRPTRCAALPLRSDKRRQVSSRCNAVLRQRCPQSEPRAAGADTRDGNQYGWPARFMKKSASSAYSNCGSSYQFHQEAICFPCPFARACDGGLLLRAAAPQSADAFTSYLRQPV